MLEEYFGSSSALQRNERVKLAAMFWNIVGAGMLIGGVAGVVRKTLDTTNPRYSKWSCDRYPYGDIVPGKIGASNEATHVEDFMVPPELRHVPQGSKEINRIGPEPWPHRWNENANGCEVNCQSPGYRNGQLSFQQG